MRTITEIIIHCTATRPDANCTVESIRRYHKSLGWHDIGYHYVIYPDGSVRSGRPIRRSVPIAPVTTSKASASPMSAALMPTATPPTPEPRRSVLFYSSLSRT